MSKNNSSGNANGYRSTRGRITRIFTIIIVVVLALAMALAVLAPLVSTAVTPDTALSSQLVSGEMPSTIIGDNNSVAAANFNYVIKLKSDNPDILKPYISKAESIFAFNNSPVFDRIYGFASPGSLEFLRQQLLGKYEYLELDQPFLLKASITVTPVNQVFANDPGFTADPANIDRQWALSHAGFTEAWHTTTGSYNITVAVIDTGIDESHEDFNNTRFAEGFNFINNRAISTGQNSDDNGHGTLVAGVIGATTNNGVGIAGAAWKVILMPIKGMDAQGSGTSSDIAQSIVWAADHGANIINMSLGGLGLGHDTTLANAITYAYRKNVLIISAAGNDVAITGGSLDENPVFPICDDNGENMILGVTASDQRDMKPDFANFGKVCVDVSAPGKRILSTINRDPVTNQPAPDSYAYASGTSLSVPHVSAQAVLLKSLYPDATAKQLRDRIISSAVNIDNKNLTQCNRGSCAGLLGVGRIDVAASLAAPIVKFSIEEGDVIKLRTTGAYYYISGGKRRPISTFVFQQRFTNTPVKDVDADDITQFPDGQYAEPLDETLVKLAGDQTVYSMSKGLRLPVTYQVFLQRNLSFANVYQLSYAEINSWVVGSFLAPAEGTLLRTTGNQTVYWVVGGVLHPINYNFFVDRALNIFPVVYVSDNDLKGFSKGEAYIR